MSESFFDSSRFTSPLTVPVLVIGDLTLSADERCYIFGVGTDDPYDSDEGRARRGPPDDDVSSSYFGVSKIPRCALIAQPRVALFGGVNQRAIRGFGQDTKVDLEDIYRIENHPGCTSKQIEDTVGHDYLHIEMSSGVVNELSDPATKIQSTTTNDLRRADQRIKSAGVLTGVSSFGIRYHETAGKCLTYSVPIVTNELHEYLQNSADKVIISPVMRRATSSYLT